MKTNFNYNSNEKELVNIFKDLIRINTTNPPGNEKAAIEYIKKIFDKESIENRVLFSKENRGNIIGWIKGEGESYLPPAILLSHIDVVKADGDWKFPPFEAIEENGIIYGRGTLDTKQLTAMQMMTIINIKRSNIKLNRDILFIASADEENGSKFGMEYIKANYPQYTKNAFVISEGGGFIVKNKDKAYRIYTAGEKGTCKIRVKTCGSGGHASCPPKDQALIRMSTVLEKISKYTFKEELSSISSEFIRHFDDGIEDETLNNLFEYITHSSMVINSFSIGDAINSIPTQAEAEIEIRFIFKRTEEEIKRFLEELFDGFDLEWDIVEFSNGYESNIESELVKIMREKNDKYGEGEPLIPIIALGRTDGRFMEGNIYGFSPILSDMPFSEVLKKVHSVNECISVKSLIFGFNVINETLEKFAINNGR